MNSNLQTTNPDTYQCHTVTLQ